MLHFTDKKLQRHNKWKVAPCLWIGMINIKMARIPKLASRCNVVTIKITDGFFFFFFRNGQSDHKNSYRITMAQNSQKNQLKPVLMTIWLTEFIFIYFIFRAALFIIALN